MQLFKSFTAAICAAGILLAFPGLPSRASSHSDAPLIKQDPSANLTDVYAFVGNKYGAPGTKVLNIVINVHPFCEPGDGAIYDRFADDALYSIHITDPKTGATVLTYNFQYSAVNPQSAPGLKNPNTILSYGRGTQIGGIQQIGDVYQNFTQFYTVTKVTGGVSTVLNPNQTLICAPPNPGARVTPLYNDANGVAVSGATTEAGLDPYTKQAVYTLPSGETVFSGQREDSFFADAPGIFDLLNSRILVNSSPPAPGLGQQGNGVDGFKGYNVLTYAIQVPISELASANIPNFPSVGVYASVSRPRITLRNSLGNSVSSGPWVQVNRLANPLFNEVLVALKDKDNYNQMSPTDDIAHFETYASNPELAVLLNTVFGTSAQTTNRTDLVAIYIPDVIRVDTSTPAVPLDGQPGFNRLSLFGGDMTTNGSGTSVPSGWPNGRRFGDDVVDIALTVVVNGPTFVAPITLVGDNVPFNDQVYNQVFPYAATPWGGTRNSKDSGPNVAP
jgi:hypothetical protein